MKHALTPLQSDCLDAISKHAINNVAPSFECLKSELGLASKSQVHRLVHQLQERGYVSMGPGRYRSLKVIDAGGPYTDAALSKLSDDALFDLANRATKLWVARDGGDLTKGRAG